MGTEQGITCHKCLFITRKAGIQKLRELTNNYLSTLKHLITWMKKVTTQLFMSSNIMMDTAIISILVPRGIMNTQGHLHPRQGRSGMRHGLPQHYR